MEGGWGGGRLGWREAGVEGGWGRGRLGYREAGVEGGLLLVETVVLESSLTGRVGNAVSYYL